MHINMLWPKHVKFQNDWQKTVGGVALTSQLLTNGQTGHGTPISHLHANAGATKRKNVAPRFVFFVRLLYLMDYPTKYHLYISKGVGSYGYHKAIGEDNSTRPVARQDSSPDIAHFVSGKF